MDDEKRAYLKTFVAPKNMALDQIILKAIPFNGKCAIEESGNKIRREALKKRIEEYISIQLANQFNAKPVTDQTGSGVPGTGN